MRILERLIISMRNAPKYNPEIEAAPAYILGLVQATEVDSSNINGNGLYTHANMAAGEIN